MTELVGKGRPFYSAMDMGAKALKRKVGTGSEFLKELMGLPGVKPTELKERGLEHLMNEPKMTHEKFLGHLARKPAPRINEKVLGGDRSEPDSEAPYHGKWTLPGGENYREMLIKQPGKDVFAVPQHYNDEPNILASMRLKDRTGPNGEKLLHLEELQSDWHQQGREKGYKDPQAEQKFKQIDDLRRTFFELNKRRRELHEQALQEPDAGPRFNGLMEEANGITPKLLELNSQIHDLDHLKKQQQDAVPDAPFKKNWEEMALKRLIHHAAEKGYHGIVVTPGAEQADRYGLAKHIGMMSYNPEDQHFQAFKPNRETAISERGATPERVSELVGKELAQKLMSAPKQMGHHYIEGDDIKVGGEGMKGFYDKKVPNIFNAVGKKHGVKMQLHGHTIEKEPANRLQVGEMTYEDPAKLAQLHHFPITEPMRQDVLKNGLPLYNTGGVIHKAEGGNVQPSVEQMRMALQNKGTFPKYGIQSIGAYEAPSMSPKYYIEPGNDGHPSVGGVDMNTLTPGMQLVQQDAQAMQPPQGIPQGAPQGGNNSSPLGAPPSPQGGQSNILSMTPQGQALGAMTTQQPPKPMGMATGGDVKKKKPTVDEIKQAIFQKAQEGLSKPSEILGKHEGKYLHLTEADRAKVEKRLHGLRGGVGFSQIGLENPEYKRRTWGVGKPGTATKLLNRQTRGLSPEDQAIWSTFIGTPEMHTSNQLVFNRMWNKFQEARASGKLSPELEQKMLDIMRSAMIKATKKSPAKAIFDPDVDFDNTHHLFDTFERRRILANLMAGNQIGGKKGQIFDASKMIEDTTDPKLLHAPSMSVGPHLFTFTGETSYEPHLNKAFPHMLHGETSPDTFQQIPFNTAAPDFVNQIKQEKGRAPGYMDIVRRIPRQHLSEEYLTMLQKMGYKKGGKVANMDTMRLELSKKTKKA